MDNKLQITFSDFWAKLEASFSAEDSKEFREFARSQVYTEMSRDGWLSDGVVSASSESSMAKVEEIASNTIGRVRDRAERKAKITASAKKHSHSLAASIVSAQASAFGWTPSAEWSPAQQQQVETTHVPVATNPSTPKLEGPSTDFDPSMASYSERCPKCRGEMSAVSLANNMNAVFCSHDRVVLPVDPNKQ